MHHVHSCLQPQVLILWFDNHICDRHTQRYCFCRYTSGPRFITPVNTLHAIIMNYDHSYLKLLVYIIVAVSMGLI